MSVQNKGIENFAPRIITDNKVTGRAEIRNERRVERITKLVPSPIHQKPVAARSVKLVGKSGICVRASRTFRDTFVLVIQYL